MKETGGYFVILKMFFLELFRRKIKLIINKIPLATVVNEWSNNYFHWFTEVLPKVYFLKTQLVTFNVLLPSNYVSGFQLDSLRLLNIPVTYFEGLVLTKEICVPNRHAPYPAHYNPSIIKNLVTELKSRLDLSFDLGPYIYITRRKASARKVYNEKDVLEVLMSFGFTTVEFESLSFNQQVAVAHHAKVIVSIHGAGLTNIMFCESQSSVYEFSLEGETMDKCYYTLADACDLKYYYQLCESNASEDSYTVADLKVNLEELENNLISITGNA